MANRKVPLVTGEYYHIYLRGVEKRDIVMDDDDIKRFLMSLRIFNATYPVGSIYEYGFQKKQENNQLGSETSKLVDILAYNILSNHYHLLLMQVSDRGISKFMQSLNGGYTKYFNNKYERVGALFQGVFSSAHVNNESQLSSLCAYVNLNHIIHQLGSETSKWGQRSSWGQYVKDNDKYEVLCNTKPVCSLYANRSECVKDMQENAQQMALERKRQKMEEEEILKHHLEVSLPSGVNGGKRV